MNKPVALKSLMAGTNMGLSSLWMLAATDEDWSYVLRETGRVDGMVNAIYSHSYKNKERTRGYGAVIFSRGVRC